MPFMKHYHWAFALLFVAGCGDSAKDKPPDAGARMEQAAKQLGEAARSVDVQKMGDAMAKMGGALVEGSQVEPVDHRKLRELLPEALGTMKRRSSEGSRTNVMGIASSKAVAQYADGKGSTLEAEIIDAGSLTGVTAMAFAWVKVEIDKEGDAGYERTSTVGGRKMYERYSKADRTGELDILVASRFVVQLRGKNLDANAFRAAIAAFDLAKLETLK